MCPVGTTTTPSRGHVYALPICVTCSTGHDGILQGGKILVNQHTGRLNSTVVSEY